jgi:MoaA/NifB/PqqE/SkfB family radical SAM enzyme
LTPVKIWKGEEVPRFTSLGTEISAQCNRSCVFCPNHDFTRPDQDMPMSMIEKIRDELAEMNYGGRWHPYMYNEPLRDKRLMRVLRMFRRDIPRAIIGISTNCDYLTPEILAELIEIGVNSLTLNIYSARDGNENPDKVQRGIELAKKRAKVVQGWLDQHKNVVQKGSLYTGANAHTIIGKVLHKYGVQKDSTNFGGSFKLQNRSGNVAWLASEETSNYSGTCVKPFRVMEMRWTGDVVLCCQDYNGIKSYGNIKDNTLVEIWNSMALHKKREQLQQGIRKGPLCGNCDYNGGTYKHMIHPVQIESPTRAKR